jgi:hypothetical protein
MTSSSFEFPSSEEQRDWKLVGERVLRSRWTFAVLQVLDLLTTLAAFRIGGLELNPLVARLTIEFGRLRGVIISKLIAIVIAMGVRRLIWAVNLFYAGIVSWNVIVLIVISVRHR